MKNNQDVILLNNLFNGEYVKEKVGGEIINMYQSDNGNYYVYINPYGNIEKKWDNRIKYILFIRSVGNKFVKIIGKAEVEEQISLNGVFNKLDNTIDPTQKSYIECNNIQYGGASISELGSWSKYFVSFKAKGIYKPKEDIYLSSEIANQNSYQNTFCLNKIKKINNQSQKLYIDKKTDSNNYQIIENIINNSIFWESNPVEKVILEESSSQRKSLMSIIKKENDELANSNLLAFFLESDKDFWFEFSKSILKISNLKINSRTPKITRESVGNIDLFIEIEDHVIVIENKIKSGISGRSENGYSQLEKYVNVAEEYKKSIKKNIVLKYYILRPNYNNENFRNFTKGNMFTEIKYSEIYNIIKDKPTNFYMDEFRSVIKKHSAEYNNELFELMNERFIEQIKSNKKN